MREVLKITGFVLLLSMGAIMTAEAKDATIVLPSDQLQEVDLSNNNVGVVAPASTFQTVCVKFLHPHVKQCPQFNGNKLFCSPGFKMKNMSVKKTGFTCGPYR